MLYWNTSQAEDQGRLSSLSDKPSLTKHMSMTLNEFTIAKDFELKDNKTDSIRVIVRPWSKKCKVSYARLYQ